EEKSRLQEKIAIWYGEENLVAQSENESIEIPRSLFEFDIDKSIQELEERTKRSWSTLFMKKKNVHLPLVVNINDEIEIPDYINSENLKLKASQVASNLGEEVIAMEYREGATIDTEVIA